MNFKHNMLRYKLHFIQVDEVICDSYLKNTQIYVADEILAELTKNNILEECNWSYWGRTRGYREDNVQVLPLSIHGGNYDLQTKILVITAFEIKKLDTFVLVGLQYQTIKQILETRTRILIFPKVNCNYKVKLGINFELYFKLLNYEGADLQEIIDLLNEGNLASDKLAELKLKNTNISKNIEIKSPLTNQNRGITDGILTECFLDYEGSTSIPFEILKASGILPQEMVYFGDTQTKILMTPNQFLIGTYTIIGSKNQVSKNQWTANGGIAHFLGKYTNKTIQAHTSLQEDSTDIKLCGINQLYPN